MIVGRSDCHIWNQNQASATLSDVRAVVFDLDGTLVDAFEDITAAVNYGLGVLGKPARPHQEIRSYVGNGLRKLSERVLACDPAAAGEVDRLTALVMAYYTEHPADKARPYPGAAEVLRELSRRGVRVAVLSNKRHELSVQVLKSLGLDEHLDIVQGEVPGAPHKPDPADCLRILKQFGVSPAEAVIVGDGEPDAELARRTGCRFIAVSYGLLSCERLRELGAVRVIDNLRDLPAELLSLAQLLDRS